MNKAVEYANKVLSGEITAPLQVRQACLNFLHEYYVLQDSDEFEFFWDDETEELIFNILHFLNFVKGIGAKQNIGATFALWQWFFVLNVLCWYHKEFPEKRRIREAILTVARKNAKTNMAALIHIITLMIDEADSNHFCAANNKKQSSILYNEIKGIINSSPLAKPLFKVNNSYIEYIEKRSVLKAMSGDTKTADGEMTHVATVDEVAASSTAPNMVNVIEGGQLGPVSPLIVKISTSYPIQNAYNFWHEATDTAKKNTYTREHLKQFALIYTIDNPNEIIMKNGEEIERWQDQNVWAEANPLVSIVPELQYDLISNYAVNKENTIWFNNFLVKNLNLWRPSTNEDEQMFIPLNKLERNQDESITWDFFRGKMVVIGLDVAMKNDNLSFVFMTYENGKTYVRDIVFYPKAEEANKTKFEGLPYAEFTAKGYCEPFGNETIDTKNLGQHVYENYIKKYDMQLGTVLFDQKYAEEIIEYFEQEVGMEVSPIMVQQNSFTLGPVISDFQQEIIDQDVLYYPNPLTTSAYINSVVHYPKGKPYIKKPENGKVKNKVDSMFASLNAFFGVRYFRKRDLFNGGKSFVFTRGER